MYLARTYLLRTLFGSALGTEPTTSRSEVKRSIDSANPVRERKPMQLFSCLILCVHLNYQRGYNIMLKITFREKTSNLLLFIKPCDYLSRGEVHSIFDQVPDPQWVLYQIDVLLVFSVTPFKIDENKNQNRSIDEVQNLGNERRYIYKDPRQDSVQRNISFTRYPKKGFTQTYRDLYGDAMLVLTWMSSNMADGNQQKHLLSSFATKA